MAAVQAEPESALPRAQRRSSLQRAFGGRRSGDRAASMVEFALVLPVLFMLIFGMITGAIAYDRNLAISYSAQQTARYAATLPVWDYDANDNGTMESGELNNWLTAVHARVQATSEDTLTLGTDARNVCVAVVYQTDPDDEDALASRRSRLTTTNNQSRSSGTCFSDGLSEPRVQVQLSRGDEIDLVVFGTIDVTLSKQAVARYEVETPSE